jgi:hypothetical protein
MQVEALAKKMQQQAINMRRSQPEVPLTQVITSPCMSRDWSGFPQTLSILSIRCARLTRN